MKSIRTLFQSRSALLGVVACALALTGCTPPAVLTPAPRSTAARGPWRIHEMEHVDLWLHGFAFLRDDSSLVPSFRMDYHARLRLERESQHTLTGLDENAGHLRARLAQRPQLASAEFLPLYFENWDSLRAAADRFLRTPPARPRPDQRIDRQNVFALYFPSAQDREWLALFIESLDDERAKFFDRFWQNAERDRTQLLMADRELLSGLWPRLSRFLDNSGQHAGVVVPALSLGGEGRTLARPDGEAVVAVGMPDDTSGAPTMIYELAHELVGGIVSTIVTENTAPADRWNGTADRNVTLGTVRAGAMLLRHVAPELVNGYMAYYLSLARRPAAGPEPERVFASIFPVSDHLRDALERQIQIYMTGT